MRNTRSLRQLLALVQEGKGRDGIYALAAHAQRPYRRVYDQVMRLAAAGQVRLESDPRSGGRKRFRVLGAQEEAPALEFNRAWSHPGGHLPPERVIAQVLARPTFNDLLACAKHYGLPAVEHVHDRMLREFMLEPGAAVAVNRMLRNITVGHERAARKH